MAPAPNALPKAAPPTVPAGPSKLPAAPPASIPAVGASCAALSFNQPPALANKPGFFGAALLAAVVGPVTVPPRLPTGGAPPVPENIPGSVCVSVSVSVSLPITGGLPAAACAAP